MDRRHFAARLALAASAVVSSTSRGAPVGRVRRVAVIGHTGRGDYGHGLDVMWKSIPRTAVVAVADADPEGLAAARRRLHGVPGFADYRSMLREVQPDLVAIAPRHVDQHHAMCLAAIEAGAQGIYIEKPFCRSPREADDIVQACQAGHVRLAVAHRNRYHPVLAVVRRLLADGEIGTLLEVRARGKEDARGGVQDLWVLGTHVFDLATVFTGPPVACSGLLYQDHTPCSSQDLRPGDEGVGLVAGNRLHARFEMADGCPLFFDSIRDRATPSSNFGLQLVGTAGLIDLRIDREPLAHLRRGNPNLPAGGAHHPWLPVTSAGVDQVEPIPELATRIASHQAAGEDLIDAMEQDRAPLCDASAGRTTVEMACAVLASHVQAGARVTLPLAHREHPLSSWQ